MDWNILISSTVAVLTALFAYLKYRDGLRFETIEDELKRVRLAEATCQGEQVRMKEQLLTLERELAKTQGQLEAIQLPQDGGPKP